jgi:LEA14-like dessication related protein
MKDTGLRNAATILLAAALLLLTQTGCSVIDALNLQKPSARLANVRLQDIDLQALTMLFDVELSNPYSVPLPLVNLDYGLASKDKPFLSGDAKLQGAVPAHGTKTVSLPAKVTYKQLLSVLTDVKLGSVIPYRADLGLSVDAPGVGPMRLPLSKEGELPVPAPPEVQIQEIKWDNISLDSAGGTVRLHVVNRNQFPIEMSKLAYGLDLGNVKVANSTIAEPLAFAANGGAGEVKIPISFSPKDLGLAVFSMLTGKGSGYKLAGDMTVKTPFGPMSLGIDKAGNTVFKK